MAWGFGKKDSRKQINNYTPEVYHDGFDISILFRKDNKINSISKIPFSPIIPKDAWKNRLNKQDSIREYKSEEVLY